MSRPLSGVKQLVPAWLLAPVEPAHPERVGPRTRRDLVTDAAVVALALVLGVLVLISDLRKDVIPVPTAHEVIDAAFGLVACASLWWRRQWPFAVALGCVVLGAFSSSATFAGVFALSSLAVHRPVRPALLVAALWFPSGLVYAVYSGRTDVVSVMLLSLLLVAAATSSGMYVRARRQLVLSLRERALRAEADQRLYAEQARMAERTRIAREMHDVLAHRISLVALQAGALKVRPDLPVQVVRDTAELLRSTACQALEELSSVIGVLREEAGREAAPAAPQPTLSDIPRLVHESRRAGAKIELDMRVEGPDTAPSGLGRDAYRIVQEALTNIGKHAGGTAGRVEVTGRQDGGLHVLVRNRLPVGGSASLPLPRSGAGLLGLQERVTLAGGTLLHGPDGSGDFVVDARLPW
jgi:signal transduction histidine kinase